MLVYNIGLLKVHRFKGR